MTVDRAGTCILLDDGERGLLLDCGHGTLGTLLRTGFPTQNAATLIVSHLHVDHVHGFSEWLANLVRPGGVLPRVYGPPGTAEYVRSAAHTTSLVVSLPGSDWRDALDVPVVELRDKEQTHIEGASFRSITVPHAPEVVAMAHRVEFGGRGVAFSGDTKAVPELMVPLADGADVLIHEAFSEAGLADWTQNLDERRRQRVFTNFEPTHTRVETAAQVAREAGVKRLVLTHLNPGEQPERLAAEARAWFSGEVIVAEDGLALIV